MPVFTWQPIAGKQSYFIVVAKDPFFHTVVDYAFTRIPAYAPRTGFFTTTYQDESTSYYWVVLPANQPNGGQAVGDPLAGNAAAFHKQSIPPSLLTPSTNATVSGNDVAFTWSPAVGARRYRIQVSRDPSFAAASLEDDVVTDSTGYTAQTAYPADTALYWRVRGEDDNLHALTWSAVGSFRHTLAAPIPDASNPTGGDLIPTWSWSTVRGAVSYNLEVDLPDGSKRSFLRIRSTAWTPVLMWGTGVWGWRVQANFPKRLSGSYASPWSATTHFTRTIREPGSPVVATGPSRALFSWIPREDGGNGIKEYRVQVSTEPDFSVFVENQTTQNTSYAPQLTQLQYTYGGTFYWRVAAVDTGHNLGDFTAAQSFYLAKLLRLSNFGYPVRRHWSTMTITATDAWLHPVRNARIRARGAGVGTIVRYTGSTGKATFKLYATRSGRVSFRATKSGYQTTTLYVAVH
jgi:hypothetical protein